MNNSKSFIFTIAISLSISPLFSQDKTGKILYKSEMNAELQSGEHRVNNNVTATMTVEFLNEAYRLTMTSMKGGFMAISDADLQSQYNIYDPKKNQLIHVANSRPTSNMGQNQVQLENVKISDENMNIHGIVCVKFECDFRGKPASGYFAPTLPATISTMGNLGLPGALMAFESESTKIWVEAIDLDYPVDKNHVIIK